jgi:hypothetical protein
MTYPSDTSTSLPLFNDSKQLLICSPTQSRRVPDPYDCSIYHDCYHGIDLVSHCPSQLQYNPKKQSCDLPQNVHCMNILSYNSYVCVFLNR